MKFLKKIWICIQTSTVETRTLYGPHLHWYFFSLLSFIQPSSDLCSLKTVIGRESFNLSIYRILWLMIIIGASHLLAVLWTLPGDSSGLWNKRSEKMKFTSCSVSLYLVTDIAHTRNIYSFQSVNTLSNVSTTVRIASTWVGLYMISILCWRQCVFNSPWYSIL